MPRRFGGPVIPLSPQQVADIVGGVLVEPPGATGSDVVGVARIDSRDITDGDLFVCVSGDNVDGHDYVDQALANGAVLSLATRAVPGPHVLVPDAIEALTALARHNAAALPASCTVFALTGSSGKTSTKDLLAAVLEAAGPTIAPPGSFNNEIGLPLTVLRADATTRFLVLEMGARGLGHIAWLCSVARPRIGMELNVGSAHISEFGDADTIALAKGELVEALPADGVAILNGDDARVRGMASRTAARIVLFGTSADCAVRATDVTIDDDGRASFTLVCAGADDVQVDLRVSGRHHVMNALAAAAAAREVGIAPADIASALSTADARSRWRMEVSRTSDDVTVINDAYNANPESMAAALQAAADIAGGRRIGLVLGEMLELGDLSPQAHRDLGVAAQRIGAAWVVAVGDIADAIADGARQQGAAAGAVVAVADAAAAIAAALAAVRPDDVVLVKASRAIGLEVVADALIAGSPYERSAGGAA